MFSRASFWGLLSISLHVTVWVKADSSSNVPHSSTVATSQSNILPHSATHTSVSVSHSTSDAGSVSVSRRTTGTSVSISHSSTSSSASTRSTSSTRTSASASQSSTSTTSTSTTVPVSQTSSGTSTSTTKSSVPTAPISPGKKNPKRGLGYAGSVPGDIINANQTDSVISWVYNWASISPDYLATSNIPYVPMQWGSVGASGFDNEVETQGAKTILTFNEPDFVNEANMDPVDAASIWMQSIEPMKAQGVRLGGPAVTASSTGRPWLNTFLAACTNCTIDFLPLHWYGEGVEGFYNYIWDVHTNFPQYPIWITEFADTSGNDTEVASFLNATITYLDTLDWVERYAWFGYFRPRSGIDYNFLDENGGVNALGQIYLGAGTIHTEALPSGPAASQTVNGADIPGQAPPTSWPSISAASRNWKSASSGASIPLAAVTMLSLLLGVW